MAFASHPRCKDLPHPSPAPTSSYIANAHPDRRQHLGLEEDSTRQSSHGTFRIKSDHDMQEENYNRDAYRRNHSDDPSLNEISFEKARRDGTDTIGNKPSTSLWVGNLPPDITSARLKQAFAKFGRVDTASAKPKLKCGFVNFQVIDSAMAAWYEYHQLDVFHTGTEVYVRYQKRPGNHEAYSQKRKRTSMDTIASVSDDAFRTSNLTGPRMSNGLPPTALRPQHTSISPPPLRRHDAYRPDDQSDDERVSRPTSDRHRQNDTYRPSYGDDLDEVYGDRRGSIQCRELSARHRVQSQGSTIGYKQSTTRFSRSERSISPHSRLSQPSSREPMTVAKGLGIRGLAALRKEPSNLADESIKDTQPGVSIRGTATIAKVSSLNASKATVIQAMEISQKLATVHSTSVLRNSIVQTSDSASQPTTMAMEKGTLHTQASNSITCMPVLGSGLADGESKVQATVVAISSTESLKENETVADQDQSKAKLKRGFPHLSYLYEHKDREDLVAQKARTTSPFGRLRASTRERSVESALTDPTPVLRPPVSTEHACEKCKVAGRGGFIRLFRCNVPSCAKKLHSTCGNLIELDPSTESEQKAKFLCDECLKLEQKAPDAKSSTKPTPIANLRSTRTHQFVTAKTRTQTVANDAMLPSRKTVDYCFVSADSPVVRSYVNDKLKMTSSDALQKTLASPTRADSVVLTDPFNKKDDHASYSLVQPDPHSRGTTKLANSQPMNPPSQPRSMRDDKISSQAQLIADRYKDTVTCPWWKKSNRCVRLEKDCMFAHKMTGIDSPNGHSVAKDWTCHDHLSPKGCRLSERDCLYSHTDTGLYVGVDGKASKKHLECWWWRYHARCTYSEAKCTCAHRSTGLVAEEPMSKDAARRATIQPSRFSLPDYDAFSEPRTRSGRSASYSPPPPPAPTTTNTRSFTITEAHVQAPSLATPDDRSKQADSSLPSPESAQAAATGIDPRLRRAKLRTLNSDTLPELPINGDVTSDAPVEITKDSAANNSNGIATGRQTASQPSKQSTMNSCKMCTKLVFKADFCTDCLKQAQTQTQHHSQKSIDQQMTEAEDADIPADDVSIDSVAKPAVFAIPGPKVLKRSRQASTSNVFASKRMRPNLTNVRSATYPSAGKSNIGSTQEPVTLEELNRINEKKAEKLAQALAANEPDSSMIEVVPLDGDASRVSAPRAAIPLQSATKTLPDLLDANQITISPITTQISNVMSSKPGSERPKVLEGIDFANEIYEDPEVARSRSESVTSNDSDAPLAALRPRSENALWSSSTSTQSPPKPREKTPTVLPALLRTVPDPKSIPSTTGTAAVRCRSCIINHRKCVHTVAGRFDGLKCYLWQKDRDSQTTKKQIVYSKADQNLIKLKALEYQATLHADHELTNVSDAVNEHANGDDPTIEAESDTGDDEDSSSSLSDEIQIGQAQSRRRDKPATSASKERPSRALVHESPRILSRPSMTERREKPSHTYRLNFAVPEGMILVHKPKPKEDLANVIARLKARGVAFEDSDTSDDEEDDCPAERKMFDPRIDPLLYYKFGDKSALSTIKLPTITKSQGLKNSARIRHRSMMRSYRLFGNPHKQVSREVKTQEVSAIVVRKDPTAIVARKDPDDESASPKEAEEKMTLQEFVGFSKDEEPEACLGKVSLPRSKFTMELAFREKDTGPELDIWGRERRGNKKEKPVFVIGM